jgi:hypothetical protein
MSSDDAKFWAIYGKFCLGVQQWRSKRKPRSVLVYPEFRVAIDMVELCVYAGWTWQKDEIKPPGYYGNYRMDFAFPFEVDLATITVDSVMEQLDAGMAEAHAFYAEKYPKVTPRQPVNYHEQP